MGALVLVDAKKKPKGKPKGKKPKPSVKGECKNTGPKPDAKIFRKYTESAKGCPGVCNNEYTLSGKGFPCYSDNTNKDCAWCTESGYQCKQDKNTGPDSKGGSRCTNAKNKNYCESQKGDCQFIPACDGNAECKFKKSLSKYINFWKCECKKPYKGN